MNSFQKNLFIYFISCFFIFLSVICQDIIPDDRIAHSSALINNKLYFFGGATQATNYSNETFNIDLSSIFNISTPPFKKVSVGMPVGVNLATCVSTLDNSSIFLIGGRMTSNSSGVYKFDSINLQWSIPNISGFNNSFVNRNEIKAIIDDNGKVYILGGTDYTIGHSYGGIGNLFYDMNLFDTISMTWTTFILPVNVFSRLDYAATLLPNGQIIYIGGETKLAPSSGFSYIDMNDILIFDTKSFGWSNKTASGTSIQKRVGHTAVLIKDGNIIIYGGGSGNAQVYPDLAILNTNTWVWSIPNIPLANAPPSLERHSANLYGIYMIIAFGRKITQVATLTYIYSNSIYIFNTETYSWVSSFDISNKTSQGTPTTNDGTPTNQDNFSTGKIILFVSIGIIGTIILFVIGFFGKKYYKNNTNDNENERYDNERYANQVIKI